jgi:hypothetical protein
MHVTHLDDQIIATRGVLGSAIPLQGVAKPRPCRYQGHSALSPVTLLDSPVDNGGAVGGLPEGGLLPDTR